MAEFVAFVKEKPADERLAVELTVRRAWLPTLLVLDVG